MTRAIIIALTLLCSSEAIAAPICTSFLSMSKQLKDRYVEEPIGAGLTNEGQMLQIFASKAGTWTAVQTRQDGLSCIMAAGTRWKNVKLGDPT